MTHNTREVEEVINEFKEKRKLLFTRGGLSVLLDYEPHDIVLDEKSVIEWLRTTLYHQLQKARQDWLREEIMILERMLIMQYMKGSPASYQNKIIKTIIDRYQEELDQNKK